MSHHTARVQSMAAVGIDAVPIEIEVHAGAGLPAMIIVGLPDAAIHEARDRVRSACINAGLPFPRKRVTINLAPAHVRKTGSHYDVPIALGILAAEGHVRVPATTVCIGELALDGRTRPVSGALIAAHRAIQNGHTVILPAGNAAELALLQSDRVRVAEHITEIVAHVRGQQELRTVTQWLEQQADATTETATERPVNVDAQHSEEAMRFEDIVGQDHAKYGLLVAAAGGHNMLLSGPPGVGKTVLARALPSILPPLSPQEMIEITKLHSIVQPGTQAITTRPFRSPHHSASQVAIVGGGSALRPGELSLAHHGILFLDELPEFRRDVIEALREPLEHGVVTVSRASGSATYPCAGIVIGAYNPCPCGYWRADSGRTAAHVTAKAMPLRCRCSDMAIERYQQKLSGPLVDRFDMKIVVEAIDPIAIQQGMRAADAEKKWSSEVMKRQVAQARKRQHKRQGVLNAAMTQKGIESLWARTESADTLLQKALAGGLISMRGYTKALRIAATIADLECVVSAASTAPTGHSNMTLTQQHVATALSVTQRQQ